jgi:hypothetical protein
VPTARKLRLHDLRIRFSGDADALPTVVGARSQRYLPVHLGGTNLRYMPVLLKFLSAFGPGDLKPMVPPPTSRTAGDAIALERLRIGNVILRRRRWISPAQPLLQKISVDSDARSFEVLNRWRLSLGIPDRVFVVEKIQNDYLDDYYKPQYIDFTSPMFLSVFRSVLASGIRQINVDEMLPTPEVFPSDASGVRWGLELQLDGLVLNTSPVLLQQAKPESATMSYGEMS